MVVFELDTPPPSLNGPTCMRSTCVKEFCIPVNKRIAINHCFFLTVSACLGFSASCCCCCLGLLSLDACPQQFHKCFEDVPFKEREEKPYVLQHVCFLFGVDVLACFYLRWPNVGLMCSEVNPEPEAPDIRGAYAAQAQGKRKTLKHENAIVVLGLLFLSRRLATGLSL